MSQRSVIKLVLFSCAHCMAVCCVVYTTITCAYNNSDIKVDVSHPGIHIQADKVPHILLLLLIHFPFQHNINIMQLYEVNKLYPGFYSNHNCFEYVISHNKFIHFNLKINASIGNPFKLLHLILIMDFFLRI